MAELQVINGAPIKPDFVVKLRPGEVEKARDAAAKDGMQDTFFSTGADTFVASSRYKGVAGPKVGTELRHEGALARVTAITQPGAGRDIGTVTLAIGGFMGVGYGIGGVLKALGYPFLKITPTAIKAVPYAVLAIGAGYAFVHSTEIAAAIGLGGNEQPAAMKAFGEVVSSPSAARRRG